MTFRILPALILPLTLAACATPETRVRNGLVEAGISRPVAGCMAGRMVDRLSLGQLMKLGKLKRLRGRDAAETSIAQYVADSRALQDPEIVAVIASSGAICALSSRP